MSMRGTIRITPLPIIGSEIEAVQIRYRTNHGNQGPHGSYNVLASQVEAHLRDTKIELRQQGVHRITVGDRRKT
jgi:hypothetical protein